MALRERSGEASHKLSLILRGTHTGRRANDSVFQRYGIETLQEVTKDTRGEGRVICCSGRCQDLGPPEVIKEMAEGFPTLAWEEAGLTTQTVKNRIFVQSSAQAS